MTKESKIWHPPQEKTPEENNRIVFYAGVDDYLCWGVYKDGKFLDDPRTIQQIEWESEEVSKWAYVSDLVAASKALDVAIYALKRAAEPLPGGEITGGMVNAQSALQEIDNILSKNGQE